MSSIYAIIHQWHARNVSMQLASRFGLVFFSCGYIFAKMKNQKKFKPFAMCFQLLNYVF